MKNKIIEEVITKYETYVTSIPSLEKYIDFCIENNLPKSTDVVIENHHILPKKLFPEFADFKKHPWNRARLSLKNHFISHCLCADAIAHSSTILAIRLMSRAFKGLSHYDKEECALLYEKYRIDVNRCISNTNTGRKMSDENRAYKSEMFKDTAVYKRADGTGENLRLNTFDPRVLSGEYISYRIGYIHADSTKEKMSMARTGRLAYTNGITTIYIHKNDNIPEGFYPGFSPTICKKLSETFTNSSICYNESGEQIRVLSGNPVPEGFKIGRVNFGKDGNPFAGVKISYNHLTGESTRILQNEMYPRYCTNPQAKFLFVYDGHIGAIGAISEKFNFPVGFIHECIKHPTKTVSSKSKTLKHQYLGKEYGSFGFKQVTNEDLRNNQDMYDKFIWVPAPS